MLRTVKSESLPARFAALVLAVGVRHLAVAGQTGSSPRRSRASGGKAGYPSFVSRGLFLCRWQRFLPRRGFRRSRKDG